MISPQVAFGMVLQQHRDKDAFDGPMFGLQCQLDSEALSGLTLSYALVMRSSVAEVSCCRIC